MSTDSVNANMAKLAATRFPDTIACDRRVGLMAGEDHVERLSHWRQIGVVERAFREGGGVACGKQEPILLPKGNLELLEDPQQHLGTGLRAESGSVEAEIGQWITGGG
jgi:hypothetical protein